MRPWVRLLVVAILASVSSVSAAPIGDTAKVTVTRELVSLYGVPIVTRVALTEQRVGWKIEALMEALTDRRSHLSEGPSTQAGDLRCVLDVAPSVEFLIVKRDFNNVEGGYAMISEDAPADEADADLKADFTTGHRDADG